METDSRIPTGEWSGFFLEFHRPCRGWMHLYMSFADGKIKGEGTDYVAPWVCQGEYDLETGLCSWVKQYMERHQVLYSGKIGPNGIMGHWEISSITGQFHIWPKAMGNLDELYMADDRESGTPSILLGPGMDDDFSRMA